MAGWWVGGGVCCTCIVGAGLKYLHHPARPVAVNCHFCNTDHKVPQQSRNSFNCPSCGQYNGFTADGDYNRPLNQTDSDRQRYYAQRRGSPGGKESLRDNGLCRRCNLNQELKLSQMSSCQSEGAELDEYLAHLERVYRLCPECEETVSARLAAQDAHLAPTLLAHKLETSRCHNRSTITPQPPPSSLPLIAALLLWLAIMGPAVQWIISAAGLSWLRQFWPDVVGSIRVKEAISLLPLPLSALLSSFLPLISALLLSCLLPLLSLLLHRNTALSLFCLLPLLSLGLHIAVQAAVASLVCLLLGRQFTTSAQQADPPSPTRPRRQDPYSSQFLAALNRPLNTQQTVGQETHEQDVEVEEELASLQRPLLVRASAAPSLVSSSPRLEERSLIRSGSRVFGKHQTQQQTRLLFPPRLSSPLLRSGPEISFNHEFAIQNSSAGEGRDCDISSLSLVDEDEEEEERHGRSGSGSPFTPRLYSPDTTTAIRFTARPPLLRPSRLTSWVAGGYWGHAAASPAGDCAGGQFGGAATRISRASSQSSGFASASVPSLNICPTVNPSQSPFSSLPNSVADGRSLYGGDRCSLLSEPILRQRRSPTAGSQRHQQQRSRRGYVRPTQEEDLSDCEDSLAAGGLQPSFPAVGLQQESPRRWSKTITIELTPERVLMACSVAFNVILVGYYIVAVS